MNTRDKDRSCSEQCQGMHKVNIQAVPASRACTPGSWKAVCMRCKESVGEGITIRKSMSRAACMTHITTGQHTITHANMTECMGMRRLVRLSDRFQGACMNPACTVRPPKNVCPMCAHPSAALASVTMAGHIPCSDIRCEEWWSRSTRGGMSCRA